MANVAVGGTVMPRTAAEPAWLRWRAVYAHRWRTYTHIWRNTVVSRIAEPMFFLAAMGVGLGSLVDHRHDGQLGGLSYLEYVGPGLVAAAALQTAAFESTWPILGSITWFGTFNGMLAGPLTVTDLVAGQLAWIVTSLSTSSAVYLAVVAAFGAVHSAWALLAWPAAVLCGTAVAAPIVAFAATVTSDTAFSVLYRFGVIPLFLFSGTFFPITQLPRWMQFVAYATPLWHGVSLTRDLALGHPGTGDLAHVAYLLALLAIGVLLARRTFRRRLVT